MLTTLELLMGSFFRVSRVTGRKGISGLTDGLVVVKNAGRAFLKFTELS